MKDYTLAILRNRLIEETKLAYKYGQMANEYTMIAESLCRSVESLKKEIAELEEIEE